MNVYEMDGYTLGLVYEPVTNENRAEYGPDFLMSYNRGMSELTRTRFRPACWEPVTLKERTFRKSGLLMPCVEILKVAAAPDYCAESGWRASAPLQTLPRDADVVVVPRTAGEEVWVQYVHDYPPMKNPQPTVPPETPGPENTPGLPAPIHPGLCMLAAADYCRRRRKYTAAEAFEAQYFRIASLLSACDPLLSARTVQHAIMDFRGWK